MKSVKFEITNGSLEKLARGAGGAALDAAAVLREGAAAAARHAEELSSRVRLEQEIRDLRQEIRLQMQAVGEIVYAARRGGSSDSDRIQTILEYVDGLYEELEAHQREDETLRGYLICPACGSANQSDCLYCQNCGKPLSRQ